MSLPAIRTALETALDAMSPALATAWQNVPYAPTNGTAYQRAFLLPAPPDNPERGTFTRDQGIFQISLAYPLDTGPGAAEARAELVRDTFYRGASFTSGGVTVNIERTPEIAQPIIEPDRYVVPVRVRYYAHYTA